MKVETCVAGSLLAILMLAGVTVSGQPISRERLADALQEGGYVIVMRHASAPRDPPDETTANPDNTNRERNPRPGCAPR